MQKKKTKNNKKPPIPVLKVIRLKDIELKPAMVVFWQGYTQYTTGTPCE